MQGNVEKYYDQSARGEWIRLGKRHAEYKVIPLRESSGFTTLRLMGGAPGHLLPIGRKEI